MERYDIEGGSNVKKVKLDNVDVLKKALASKAFEYDVVPYSNRAVVKVRNGAGTSMYLAKGGDDLFWLNQISDKKERKGDWTWYTVRFQGQEVEVQE
jgi:hypothetical protein